jgi:hypothetical protein
MPDIFELATRFRRAIESAHSKGVFRNDIRFNDFPTGSCGDESYLLA